MEAALDRFEIEGISHNVTFLSAVIRSRRWREGSLSTDFIAEEFSEGFRSRTGDPAVLERLARVALAAELQVRKRAQWFGKRRESPPPPGGGRWVVRIGDQSLGLAETDAAMSAWRPGERIWAGRVGDEPMTVRIRRAGPRWRLSWRGFEASALVMTPRLAELEALMSRQRAASSATVLRCPMPGLVVSVAVVPGQRVRAGETLAIVEAMKMENVLRADRDLTVKAVVVNSGDILPVDAVIMEFE
jgi:propionyl-CoA carboxylase alpha chain